MHAQGKSTRIQNIYIYLEARAVVGELADAVKHQVDNLLADGVVAASVVVGSVLLARDELLGVVELAVGARAHLVAHSGLEVDEHAAGHVLAGTRLGEERVERVVAAANRLVRGHLAIGLDAVLKAVQLPAGVTGLDTGLTNVDRKALSHLETPVDFRRGIGGFVGRDGGTGSRRWS